MTDPCPNGNTVTSKRAATLGSRMIERRNNLDFIRFFAASLVIVSHAFPLSTGSDANEPLLVFSRGQLHMGGLAVMVFFIASGFLITASYDRSRNLATFIRARALRILPGLAVATFLVTFLLVPTISDVSARLYFGDRSIYVYFLKTLALHSPDKLPGAFTGNVYPLTVNGSLWTLWYEVICYALVACLGVLSLLRRRVILLVYMIALASIPILPHLGNLEASKVGTALTFARPFIGGMLLYIYRDKVPMRKDIAGGALAGLVAGCIFGGLPYLIPTLGAYALLYCAFSPCKQLVNFGASGDFSYGMYIYAFPIQQIIVHLFGGHMSPIVNMLFAFPLTLGLAVLSWHLVEKHFMRIKKKPTAPAPQAQ